MEKRRDETSGSEGPRTASQEGAPKRYPVSDDQLRTQILDEYAHACEVVGPLIRSSNECLQQLAPEDRDEVLAELRGLISRFTKTGEWALAVL